MNQVSFYGRIASDIDYQEHGETHISSFSLAVNRQRKGSGADFFRCKGFGKTAELLRDYFGKGSRIAFTARASQPPKYQNKDGQDVYPNVEFLVQQIDFVDTKAESENVTKPSASETEFMDIPATIDEEVPFS